MPAGKGAAAAPRAYNEPFNASFSDWDTEVHTSASTGETTFVLMTVCATSSKPLETHEGILSATGRRCAVLFSKINNSQIRHEATYWNVPDLGVKIALVNA